MTVRKAASAGLWSALDLLLRQGIQFGVSIALARLLDPADFGVIALLTFFANLSMVFLQGGLMVALIQRQNTSVEEESSIFWLNMAMSVVFAIVIVGIAAPGAAFYGKAVLHPLMWVIAAQIVASAAGAVHGALLTRALEFRALTKAGLASSLISGAIGVGAALLHMAVWALALQIFAAAMINSVGLWIVSAWRPRLMLSLRVLKPILGFSAWVSLSSTLDVFYTQGFSLLIGKFYGLRELGIYNRAANTQALPTNILFLIIARVALPLFSTRSSDREALRRGARLAVGVPMLLNVPIMLGTAALAGPIIQTLFGAKWLPAAPILAILSFAGLLLPLNAINLQIILSLGESSTYFRVETAKKILGIGCIAVGSLFGLYGLAASQIVAAVLAFAMNSRPVARKINYNAVQQLRDLVGLLVPGGLMYGVILGLSHVLAVSAAVELLILIPTGAIVYVGTGFALRCFPFVETLGIARAFLLRTPGGTDASPAA